MKGDCPIVIPEIAPPCDDPPTSSLSLSIIEGTGLSLWAAATATEGRTMGELTLQLGPDQAVVVGRQEGGSLEYLDPRYQPTQIVPASARRVVPKQKRPEDYCVSRGHFTLKGCARGIVLINGVPRRGGGIRPPLNGTLMLEPNFRSMIAGEDYLIETGTAVKIRLPNGTVILLGAA